MKETIFTIYPRLENDMLILKKPELKHLPDLESMVDEAEIYRFEPTHLPELVSESCRQFITHDCDRLFQEKEGIVLGIFLKEDPLHLAGLCELYDYSYNRNKISIGYRLRKSYWNRGIASSVVSLLKSYILNDLEMRRITAHVRIENTASVRVLVKNGFVKRKQTRLEDWGFPEKTVADKYVIYPPEDWPDTN